MNRTRQAALLCVCANLLLGRAFAGSFWRPSVEALPAGPAARLMIAAPSSVPLLSVPTLPLPAAPPDLPALPAGLEAAVSIHLPEARAATADSALPAPARAISLLEPQLERSGRQGDAESAELALDELFDRGERRPLVGFSHPAAAQIADLPTFPSTTAIGREHRALLVDLFRDQGRTAWIYNDSDLVTSYAQGLYPDLSLSKYEGAVIISARGQDGRTILFQPLGVADNAAAGIMKELLLGGRRAGRPLVFEAVSEAAAKNSFMTGDGRFLVSEDEKAPTYLYDTRALAELASRDYAKKRNFAAGFEKRYPDYKFIDLRRHPEMLGRMKELTRRWLTKKHFETEADAAEAALEVKTVFELLDRFDELKLYGGAVIVGQEVVAFSLGTAKSADTMTVLSEKADYEAFRGSFQIINQLFAKNIALPNGFTVLDRQSDGGIPGLRQAKLSYHPVQIVPWLRVELAGQ
ncbi:MAG: phosphatidylglycerol lysyltransferase domain-containing protein [Elusimicrobiota bacterium]